MRFGLLQKRVSYLVAGLGLYSVTLGGELPLPAQAMVWGGFAASYLVDGAALRRPRYARAWSVAVLLLFALELGRALLGAPLLALGLEFAALLQVSRLFNRASARDYQQISLLAFLHLTAATVLSTHLRFAAVYGAFALLSPWMLSLSHLLAEV